MAGWREYGDVPLSVYESEFARLNSPMLPDALSVWAAAIGYSALALAMMFHEQKYATQTSIPADYHNPLSLTKPGTTPRDGVNRWMRFGSWAEGVAAWKARLTSPAYKDGAYTKTTTLADLVHVYAPSIDGNDEARYVAVVEERIAAYKEMAMTEKLVFGRVPHPPFEGDPIQKPEGQGQNDLGPRKPKGVVYHRMLGTLRGTAAYFKFPTTAALTDYGVGTVGTDGANDDGQIICWNNPEGRQSGWASGPWNNPPGDGRAFVNKYGVDAINRDLVSIEISGKAYTDPASDACLESVAQLSAYWADHLRVPWSSYPLNPATGLTFTYWHTEFAAPKPCPGSVIIGQTDAIIARTKAILKAAQEGATVPPPNAYPDHMDAGIAARMFGKVTGEDGRTYAYSEGSPISSLWLSSYGPAGWPEIKEVWSYDNGQRRYVRFAAGPTMFIGADSVPVLMAP